MKKSWVILQTEQFAVEVRATSAASAVLVANLDRRPQGTLKHPGDFPLVPVDC